MSGLILATSGLNDKSVGVLNFYVNELINYMPVKVHEAFPNLVAYTAGSCLVKAVAKQDF